MINYQRSAKNWLIQAAHDLDSASANFERDDFSLVCFLAEQAAQKALKGFLISRRQIHLNIHAITALLGAAAKFHPNFQQFVEKGKTLDKYYLSTRYPDALPEPLVPFDAYTKAEAQNALTLSQKIYSECVQSLRSSTM